MFRCPTFIYLSRFLWKKILTIFQVARNLYRRPLSTYKKSWKLSCYLHRWKQTFKALLDANIIINMLDLESKDFWLQWNMFVIILRIVLASNKPFRLNTTISWLQIKTRSYMFVIRLRLFWFIMEKIKQQFN